MNPDLKKWAEKVINEISPIARKLNKDFYPFQSAVKNNPEILFLGLNPGGGSTYESQSKKDEWEFINSYDEENQPIKMMKPERLLNGNPFFDKNSEDWKYIKGLRRILLFNEALNSDNYVLGNYYYLSTADFKEAEKVEHKEVIEKCKGLTYEMINLIRPKLIVILGTSKGIDQLKEFKNQKLVLSGHHQRLLITATYGETKAIAILHPSTMAITHHETDAINTNINEFISGKEYTEFEFKKIDWLKFCINEVAKTLETKNIKTDFKSKDKSVEIFDWVIGNEEDQLLIRFDIKNKYFGIRDFKAKTTGTSDRFYSYLQNSQKYIESIADPKLEKSNSWLVQKFFEGYEFEDLQSLYNHIANDLSQLFEKVNAI